MKTFRYDTGGRWLKGNLHIHSTYSDGGKTPVELAAMYAAEGYDFLARTDHWVASDVTAEENAAPPDAAASPGAAPASGTASSPNAASSSSAGPSPGAPLLWLDGIELDGDDRAGSYFHVIGLGRFTGITREQGLEAAMAAVREQGGLLVLAHPHWCGNTFDDALRHPFDAVEVYNHVCRWLNGKSDGLVYWDRMLESRPGTLGLAVDDAHLRTEHPGWNGGWVVVNAAERTCGAILAAVRSGNFYASCGPKFHQITCDGRRVAVRTSPVAFARLVGPTSRGQRIGRFDGSLLAAAAFDVPDDWPAPRIEIEDALGRRAWTNPLFVET